MRSPSNQLDEATYWRHHAERLAQEIRRHRQNSAAQGLALRPIDTRLYGVERAYAEQSVEQRTAEPTADAADAKASGPRLAVA